MLKSALLLLFSIAVVLGSPPRSFIQAPIRISDFSELRAIPLSEPIRFNARPSFSIPSANFIQGTRTALPQIIALRPRFQKEKIIDPAYNFGYSVSDTLTGDTKTREETRDGDVVRGSYSVADPDGRIRTVTYTADADNGFVAEVTYDGKDGPVSIASEPSKPKEEDSNEGLFTQINDDFQFDDAVVIEGRSRLLPKESIRSESLSLIHPVSIPQNKFVRLQSLPGSFNSPSLIPKTSHFITPDGQIIEAVIN